MMLHYGHKRNYWVVLLTFFVALLLTVLPLPRVALYFRPEWVFLVLAYWLLFLPDRVGVGTAWVLGLLLDVIMHSLLGMHAFSLMITAYILLRWKEQLKLFPLLQQTLFIVIISAVYLGINLMLEKLADSAFVGFAYWLPLVTTTLIWPLVCIILHDLHKKCRIA